MRSLLTTCCLRDQLVHWPRKRWIWSCTAQVLQNSLSFDLWNWRSVFGANNLPSPRPKSFYVVRTWIRHLLGIIATQEFGAKVKMAGKSWVAVLLPWVRAGSSKAAWVEKH